MHQVIRTGSDGHPFPLGTVPMQIREHDYALIYFDRVLRTADSSFPTPSDRTY